MKKLFLLCNLVILIFLVGCKETLKTNNYEDDLLPIAKMQDGYSLGLYEDGQIVSKKTFSIKEDTFNKEIVLGNQTSKKETFLLMVYDHGKQIEFTANDKESSLYYKFEVPANEFETIPISLRDIESGFHSINYIIIRDPDKYMSSLEENLLYNQLYTLRINLLKDVEHIPTQRPNLTSSSSPSSTPKINGVFISDPNTSYTSINNIKAQEFEYKLFYGNRSDIQYDFYLVSLLNWEQVNITEHELYLYDQLEEDEERYLEQRFDHELINDQNYYIYLMLNDPFAPLDDSHPYAKSTPHGSNRVIIERP
ncbi:hypothetical protein [Caldalkalibacillus mannanilyticus]|uniref:hypothetical protein n=1 Tax=Caldalkalibacillus mannanilyticus TaxID=1418 RepID=UPI0004680036|nr:hypothetical protein [Caldalkalibacillus mannanilyticus]